jgi:hypothetical protein
VVEPQPRYAPKILAVEETGLFEKLSAQGAIGEDTAQAIFPLFLRFIPSDARAGSCRFVCRISTDEPLVLTGLANFRATRKIHSHVVAKQSICPSPCKLLPLKRFSSY